MIMPSTVAIGGLQLRRAALSRRITHLAPETRSSRAPLLLGGSRAAVRESAQELDFAGGSAMTVAIAWGDLATAYVSTGIPNIEAYASMPLAAAIASRALTRFRRCVT
jgi:short subunit dehydrogenase-like uncharacterized protein